MPWRPGWTSRRDAGLEAGESDDTEGVVALPGAASLLESLPAEPLGRRHVRFAPPRHDTARPRRPPVAASPGDRGGRRTRQARPAAVPRRPAALGVEPRMLSSRTPGGHRGREGSRCGGGRRRVHEAPPARGVAADVRRRQRPARPRVVRFMIVFDDARRRPSTSCRRWPSRSRRSSRRCRRRELRRASARVRESTPARSAAFRGGARSKCPSNDPELERDVRPPPASSARKSTAGPTTAGSNIPPISSSRRRTARRRARRSSRPRRAPAEGYSPTIRPVGSARATRPGHPVRPAPPWPWRG